MTTWYKDGLKFECTQCGKCCTGAPGYVWVTIPEIYRIAEHLGLRARDFIRQYVRQIGRRFSLVEMPNGDCVFFEKGCKIYPVRPTQCRTFPFWREFVANPFAWDDAAKDCEGINQGRMFTREEIESFLQES